MLAATEIVTEPVPVPLAGLTVTQFTPLAAVQPHEPRFAVTVTVLVAPLAGAESALADNAVEHGAAACVMVYGWSAIVRVAVLAAPVLADIVTRTVPVPVPAVGLTAAHDVWLDAIQPQLERLALTAMLAVETDESAEVEPLDNEKVQDAAAWLTV